MKSIKPGRGPSKNVGISSIFAALFGVFWTIVAISIGGYIMIPFGLLFIGIAVYQAVYNLKNASSKNRHSIVDIVDEQEEPDPLNEKFGINHSDYLFDVNESNEGSKYCPYCGKESKQDYNYCQGCGKKLPK